MLENAHHKHLSLVFSPEEIKNALWSILDTKSSGLDGYNSKFYKASWAIVGNDVVEQFNNFSEMVSFFKLGTLLLFTLFPTSLTPITQVTIDQLRAVILYINAFLN